MLRGFDSRTQLERLHDRHKRFSIDVYDIHGKDDEATLSEKIDTLKKTEEQLPKLNNELH